MPKTNFVHFLRSYQSPKNKPYDGFLSFLPRPEATAADGTYHHAYRSFKGPDFCWFEFKDTQLSDHLPIQIFSDHSYLWLLCNLRTGVTAKLNSDFLIPTDAVFFYQTYIEQHELELKQGSNWFLLLGMDSVVTPSLSQEYPQLESLLSRHLANDRFRVHGQMNLHAKIKRILDSLLHIEFKPFSTYYQLASWNMRLFLAVFQGMKLEVPKETVDHELQLYYNAVDYIRNNFYDDQISIETIAAALAVSERKLFMAFENKPFSVNAQIMEFKLQEARELLLKTDQSIVTISQSLNFQCPKNFKRTFISRFQIRPIDYRNSLRIKKIF